MRHLAQRSGGTGSARAVSYQTRVTPLYRQRAQSSPLQEPCLLRKPFPAGQPQRRNVAARSATPASQDDGTAKNPEIERLANELFVLLKPQMQKEFNSMELQLELRLGDLVKREVGAAVQREVGAAVQREVGAAVQREVGAAVQREVGAAVQREVGAAVQREVGAAVQREVGAAVQREVGAAVQREVGAAVQREVPRAMKVVRIDVKRLEGKVDGRLGLVVEVLMTPHLQRELGSRAGQRTLLVDATSIVKAILQNLKITPQQLDKAVEALVDFLLEEERGFRAVIAAELEAQIFLLRKAQRKDAQLEQVDQLMQQLESARDELLPQLHVPVAPQAAAAAPPAAAAAAAPPAAAAAAAAPMAAAPVTATPAAAVPAAAAQAAAAQAAAAQAAAAQAAAAQAAAARAAGAAAALDVIKAARRARKADRRSGDDSSWSSEEDEPLGEQQGPGPASSLQSSSTTPEQLPGYTIRILEQYRNGCQETRKQLLRGSLCMLALSSLQPRPVPKGHGDGGATGGGASGGGVTGGGGDGSCGFLPSPAVNELEVDSMSLQVSYNWAELTLSEIKTSSKGKPEAIVQLQREGTLIVCAYNILRDRVEFCRKALPKDIKARGIVAWAINGSEGPEPVELRPAFGPTQILSVDALPATKPP